MRHHGSNISTCVLRTSLARNRYFNLPTSTKTLVRAKHAAHSPIHPTVRKVHPLVRYRTFAYFRISILHIIETLIHNSFSWYDKVAKILIHYRHMPARSDSNAWKFPISEGIIRGAMNADGIICLAVFRVIIHRSAGAYSFDICRGNVASFKMFAGGDSRWSL